MVCTMQKASTRRNRGPFYSQKAKRARRVSLQAEQKANRESTTASDVVEMRGAREVVLLKNTIRDLVRIVKQHGWKPAGNEWAKDNLLCSSVQLAFALRNKKKVTFNHLHNLGFAQDEQDTTLYRRGNDWIQITE